MSTVRAGNLTPLFEEIYSRAAEPLVVDILFVAVLCERKLNTRVAHAAPSCSVLPMLGGTPPPASSAFAFRPWRLKPGSPRVHSHCAYVVLVLTSAGLILPGTGQHTVNHRSMRSCDWKRRGHAERTTPYLIMVSPAAQLSSVECALAAQYYSTCLRCRRLHRQSYQA